MTNIMVGAIRIARPSEKYKLGPTLFTIMDRPTKLIITSQRKPDWLVYNNESRQVLEVFLEKNWHLASYPWDDPSERAVILSPTHDLLGTITGKWTLESVEGQTIKESRYEKAAFNGLIGFKLLGKFPLYVVAADDTDTVDLHVFRFLAELLCVSEKEYIAQRSSIQSTRA